MNPPAGRKRCSWFISSQTNRHTRSSLDSTAAVDVVELLRDLAVEKGLAVVCSIHQPSNEVFFMFSKIYLLSSKGQQIYFDSPAHMIGHFESAGIKCPKTKCIADIAIDVASDPKVESNENLLNNNLKLSKDVDNVKYVDIKEVASNVNPNCASGIKQMWLIAKRHLTVWNVRMPLLLVRLIVNFIMSILLAKMFLEPAGREDGCMRPFNQDLQDLEGDDFRDYFIHLVNSIKNTSVLIFCFMFYSMLMSVLPTLLIWPSEERIIKNEMINNWYRLPAYFLGKTLCELPVILFHQYLLSTMTFLMLEYDKELFRYAMFVLIGVTMHIIGETLGEMLSAINGQNMYASIDWFVSIAIPIIFFCGLFQPTQKLPIYYQPLSYLSYFKHTMDLMIAALYGLGKCQGDPRVVDVYSEAAMAYNPAVVITGTIKSHGLSGAENVTRISSAINVEQEYVREFMDGLVRRLDEHVSAPTDADHQLSVPSYIIQHFQVHDDKLWMNVLALAAYYFVMKVITYYTLKRRVYNVMS